MPFSCSITLHLPNQNSNRQRRRSLRCIIVLPVKRKPTDAVHITPALLRCVFNGFQSDLLKLRSRAVFFDDGKTLGTMNLISVDMLLKQADFLGSRFPAVMLVKSRNDFLADVEELRLETDEHSCQRGLPLQSTKRLPCDDGDRLLCFFCI